MFPIFDPYVVTKCKLMNLLPKGEWHPFLYKLSYPIYYLTQFHLLWNPIPPYLRQICWPVLLWEEASHTQFRMENSLGTVGSSWVWVEPLEASPLRSSQSLWCTWRVSLSVRLVHSTISELWAYMQYAVSIWCLKFCLLVVLNQLQKPGHCLTQCW